MTEVDSRRGWPTTILGFAATFVTVRTGFSCGGFVQPARMLGTASATSAVHLPDRWRTG